jgi:hypothetical protein
MSFEVIGRNARSSDWICAAVIRSTSVDPVDCKPGKAGPEPLMQHSRPSQAAELYEHRFA